MISIYRPPSREIEFVLNWLTVILDHFSKAYDDYLIMEEFNLEPHDKRLGYFLNSNSLVNLVETNTCFKGSGSWIGLILTNRKYFFKNTTSYETGLSDHHYMILTMLKTTFQEKRTTFVDIIKIYFIFENFKSDPQEVLANCKGLYGAFGNYFTSSPNFTSSPY